MDIVRNLFDTSDFPARWHCGNWTPPLGWLHIGSDLVIAFSYFAIPAGLAYFAIRRRDLPFGLLVGLFVAFILACGTTHLVEAIIFWKPVYRVSGVLKFMTASISILTAIVLIRSLPSLLSLPGLRGVVAEQRAELDRAGRLQQEVSAARDALERRSAEMTQRVRRTSAALSSALAVACQWRADTGDVLWEIGYPETCRRAGISSFGTFRSIRDLFVDEDATRLEQLVASTSPEDPAIVFEGRLRADSSRMLRMSARREEDVNGIPLTMTGMFRVL